MKKIMISIIVIFILTGMTACVNKAEENDFKLMFENSIFMGDSITEGFVINEILPENSVIAGAGTTAGFIYDDIEDLFKMKPDNVFIMLGSIDILIPVDDPKELFRNDMTKLIKKIKKDHPDAKIYLQSITPVTQEALNQEPRYEEIEEYNEILMELADLLSVNYVDIAILARENPNLFAEDGIHFKKEFYLLWLNKLSMLR
ncbi:GDSL-type esterase/lipase family protein [Sedimentibacter sp.]|uniref:GDSL-type esterase/lipase family protein n=1 Tax=Sedimentibacter sp. TaxID=1960295 RepID=UPI002898D31B|nr:GDSL-type esterase/lipase family protein [Sedimentibacter sp.]